MLPPHQPTRRKKIEVLQPVPSAKPQVEARAAREQPVKPSLRVLGREAPVKAATKRRIRSLETC